MANNKVDLSINFCGLKLANPFLLVLRCEALGRPLLYQEPLLLLLVPLLCLLPLPVLLLLRPFLRLLLFPILLRRRLCVGLHAQPE